jgi:hypothetical protein
MDLCLLLRRQLNRVAVLIQRKGGEAGARALRVLRVHRVRRGHFIPLSGAQTTKHTALAVRVCAFVWVRVTSRA